ncbi:MAG: hypothetical protein ACXADC_03890 [Candidatus Thorarchaeota archaeon]
MLLKNPADYKGGIWASYVVDGNPAVVESTEAETISVTESTQKKGSLRLKLTHTPQGFEDPVVGFRLDLWCYNKPVLLVRHTTTNLSSSQVDDLKVYSIFDFDIGGPTSYMDDVGAYDNEDNFIMAYDETQTFVALSSDPKPDGWEISAPLKLKVEADSRDLKKNPEMGPMDIATALQSNLGDLQPGESRSVDIVLASAHGLDEVRSLLNASWGFFKTKIR